MVVTNDCFEIASKAEGSIIVKVHTNYLSIESIGPFEDLIDSIRYDGESIKQIVLDLHDVERLDSQILTILVKSKKLLAQTNTALKLTQVNHPVQVLLKMTGLEHFF